MSDREIHIRRLGQELREAHQTIARLQQAHQEIAKNEARLLARIQELEQTIYDTRLLRAAA